MFLKSFDLHGFKSFKERTKLEFKDGITTIVGPNGSGKSNIADAFRWVLGEQKIKALRGSKGEDVIFGGTRVHKPLGMAAVHMNIDNHNKILNLPYEEVTIGRKIYRSGESDYSINGNSCRLKDIHELFNDTGLGKDSFSIIGQGEIERILNAKPEDRRGIIEELAGIVKYRNRKEESIKKIENAEINLRRVQDIIEELQGNFSNLENDAKKAEYYLEIKEKADKLELNLILNDIFDADLELDKLAIDIKAAKDDTSGLASLVKAKEVEYEKNQLKLLGLEDKLKKDRISLFELKDIINALKTELVKVENGIRTNEEKNADLEVELAEIGNRESNLDLVYQEKLEQKDRWTSMKKEKAQVINDLERKVKEVTKEKNNLLEVGEDIRYSLIDIFQEIAVLHNEIKSVAEEEANLAAREKDNNKEEEAMGLYEAELRSKLEDKIKENARLKELHKESEDDINNLLADKLKFEETKVGLSAKKEEIANKFQSTYSKYKALSDIQRDYQGYYAGVKSVLLERDNGGLKGIHGVIGELLKVDKKVEKAIETALGGSLQDIVVNSTEDAKKAIGYLKREEKGRATFLPLEVVRPRHINKEYRHLAAEKGVLGIASELVKVDGRFKAAIENLLGNVLIVENMDIGSLIAKKSGQSLKIVTLDGEQFMPGGALTGGNLGRANSMLARNRILEELKFESESLKAKLNKLDVDIDAVNSLLYPLEGKIEARRVRSREIGEQIISSNQDVELRKQEIANLEEKHSLMLYNRENIKEELEGLTKEKVLLYQKLDEKEHEKDLKEKSKSGKEQEVKAKDSLIEELNDEIILERIAMNSLVEKENAYNESLEAYYRERQDISSLIERKSKLINENLEQIRDFKLNHDQVIIENADREEEYQLLQETLAKSDSVKDDLISLNLQLEKDIKEENKILKAKEEILHGLEIREAKLDTEKSNKTAILQEKFELLPFEAMDKRVPIEDSKNAQKELRQLQSNINTLGVVNIGAIEEFVRVRDRLDFLLGQEGDLRKSIDSLLDIILEIDKIMIERFTKSFHELNKAFSETYSALFNGGEAFIELSDKEDILNSGIEIYSKPPGKTPKSLSMLSGGERALTALALLFSLLKIKPSPLCIIDEADASLDERNVVNFANYLKNYSDKTQFIVISHRQGTIEGSDNLYGVTMDKSGVSKIISVSLESNRRVSNA